MWVEEDPFVGQSLDSHSKAEESEGFLIDLSDGVKNDLSNDGGVVVVVVQERVFYFLGYGCLLCCGKEYVFQWWLTRVRGRKDGDEDE